MYVLHDTCRHTCPHTYTQLSSPGISGWTPNKATSPQVHHAVDIKQVAKSEASTKGNLISTKENPFLTKGNPVSSQRPLKSDAIVNRRAVLSAAIGEVIPEMLYVDIEIGEVIPEMLYVDFEIG